MNAALPCTHLRPEGASLHLSSKVVAPAGTCNSRLRQIHLQRAKYRAVVRELLAERGYAGVHVRDLARHCGVAIQTLYNNFGGREDILSSAVDELNQVHIARAVAESARTGRNFMLVFCDLMAEVVSQDRYYSAALIKIMNAQDAKPSMADILEQRNIAAFRECLRTMRRCGTLKEWVDIDQIATSLQQTFRSLFTMCWQNGATKEEMRQHTTVGIGLPLIGVSREPETSRLEEIVSRLSAGNRRNLQAG